jgi:hypothetical protein
MKNTLCTLILLLSLNRAWAGQPESVKAEKVVYLTIPKAGTHLLKKTLEILTQEKSYWIGLSEGFHFNPAFALSYSNRVFGGHLFPELDKFRTKYSDKYRRILMIRDPRDVMVSFTHHLYNRMEWNGCPRFDYEKFASHSFDERLQEILLFPHEYHNPACSFAYAVLWMQDPNVFVCRFEDLVGEMGGGSKEKQIQVVGDLAKFLDLNISEEKIEAISSQLFGGTWTFRKGQIGLWKESYTPENKQLFKQLMGQYLIDLGYEKDFNW